MFSKILHTFGIRALSAAVNLLIAIVLSQYLGPEGKGVQSLIITTITFVLIFANLVGGATLVYLVPRHEASLLALPSYAWTLFVALLSYILLLAFPIVEQPFILHICALAVLNSLSTINSSILIGKEKIIKSNMISMVQPLILLISLLYFFITTDNPQVKHYISSLYISFTLSAIISFYYYFKVCGRIRAHNFKLQKKIIVEMIRLGALNQVAHITQMLSFRLSFYVIDYYHGEAAVGVYSNGISLAESIWLIAKSISLVQYARISNTEDRQEAAKLTAGLIRFSLAASLLILIPLMLLPSGVFTFIFGEGFGETRTVIWALSAGVLVYNFSILAGHYFSGTGRYHINAIVSSVGLIASILLYFTLIPAYGISGAGIATSLSYLVTSLILMVLFGREYKSWYKELVPTRNDFNRSMDEIRKLFNRK